MSRTLSYLVLDVKDLEGLVRLEDFVRDVPDIEDLVQVIEDLTLDLLNPVLEVLDIGYLPSRFFFSRSTSSRLAVLVNE
jgi:hypothetical protein